MSELIWYMTRVQEKSLVGMGDINNYLLEIERSVAEDSTKPDVAKSHACLHGARTIHFFGIPLCSVCHLQEN